MDSSVRRKLFKLYGPRPFISYISMVRSLFTTHAGRVFGPILKDCKVADVVQTFDGDAWCLILT